VAGAVETSVTESVGDWIHMLQVTCQPVATSLLWCNHPRGQARDLWLWAKNRTARQSRFHHLPACCLGQIWRLIAPDITEFVLSRLDYCNAILFFWTGNQCLEFAGTNCEFYIVGSFQVLPEKVDFSRYTRGRSW